MVTGLDNFFILVCPNDIEKTEPAITGEFTKIEGGELLVEETFADGKRNEI